MLNRNAKFSIGEVVKHRIHPFRGVIFDVDPTFDNTEEWWNSIPENHRPIKDQPLFIWKKIQELKVDDLHFPIDKKVLEMLKESN